MKDNISAFRSFGSSLIFMLLIAGCVATPPSPLKTVEFIDTHRYAGKWIEIARYENRFEKGCYGASAEYTIKNDTIDVINRCYDQNASLIDEAHGRAHATDSSNAKLKVTFFWPFYGDYHVIMIADDYRYSVVGDPKRRYLWILSRTKELAIKDRVDIISALPRFGYDPEKLYWTSVRP